MKWSYHLTSVLHEDNVSIIPVHRLPFHFTISIQVFIFTVTCHSNVIQPDSNPICSTNNTPGQQQQQQQQHTSRSGVLKQRMCLIYSSQCIDQFHALLSSPNTPFLSPPPIRKPSYISISTINVIQYCCNRFFLPFPVPQIRKWC